MKTKADLLEDLEYELCLEPLEKRRKLFWELVKRYPRLRNDLLDFYVALENDL
jgi:hypothetical protein